MQRATSSSTERTPLVQPTYVFESSISRSYQKRLRQFQCAICIVFITILGIALLVTVSYNLAETINDSTASPDDVTTTAPLQLLAASPKKVPAMAEDYQPFLKKKWPLKDEPPAKWGGKLPSPEELALAVSRGRNAVTELERVERTRRPLDRSTPANRAQRAAATSEEVKPLADSAYGVEEATRALLNGTDLSDRDGGAGIGPPINGTFLEPPYCTDIPPPCPPSKYRSQDGTCNNLANPHRWGVSNIPFRRVLPADYADDTDNVSILPENLHLDMSMVTPRGRFTQFCVKGSISSPRGSITGAPLPSARDVSVTVHRPSYAHDSTFTVMLAVWGQFVDHDITATALSKGQNSSALSCCDPSQPPHPECFPVPLDVEDPFYQDYNLTCMEFVRSAPAPTCHFGPREQLNQATAYIDGSTIYGFNVRRASRLRLAADGELKMLSVGSRQLLPPSTDPNDGCNTVEMNAKGRYCFETGDDRANENLHLTTMHLLWARQHNRVASALRALNPQWDDETLFQEARRVVSAQMQHITYNEFLPAVLGVDVMWALNLTLLEDGQSDAYDPAVNPSIANHFSAAVFRFAHTLLPGLIHSSDTQNGTINYIQLHQMLFNPYTLYTDTGTKNSVKSAMDTLVHTVDPHVTTELSNHMFENPLLGNITTPTAARAPCGLDLVSLNIQRGRDHGLPAYPHWREHCGLSVPKNFSDLDAIFDELSLSRICKIYENVEDIDLYTGALAEDPKGRLLGPTLTCLISDQFLRLKIGDRFWYETSDDTVGFTIEQLTEIRKTSLAGIICANEALLDQAQPRVMEAVTSTNPLVDCMELPQPDFTPWTDPNTPTTPTTAKPAKTYPTKPGKPYPTKKPYQPGDSPSKPGKPKKGKKT